MNAGAAGLGVGPSAFVEFKPTKFLRPFFASNVGDEGDSGDSGD
jgi:hypothetical protein